VRATNKVRLAIVNSHPIQYYAPLYAYLHASGQFDVSALYCSDFSLRGARDPGFGQEVAWDIDLLSGYNAVFLGARARERVPGGFFSLVAPEIWKQVRSGGYDAVLLHGHNYAANMLALIAAKTRGIPVMMRGDTHGGLQDPRLKRAARRLVLGSLLYRLIDRFLAVGTWNRAFYRAMGVPEEKIFLVPFTVDNERFIRTSSLPGDARASLQRELGVEGKGPVLLFASKLIARKRPADLIRAAAMLKVKGHAFTLLMVGTGELAPELRALVAGLRLDNVVFRGFVNQGELPRIYAASDVFVLPSESEPWGLVVNEVMCAALPVVVASQVGCVPDLVEDGVNGYCYDATDVGALATALEKLIVDPALRTRMGKASLARISHWSFRECKDGLVAATAAYVSSYR
jgi:glycosyltransferase involved in cell wall biosynthesis